MNPISRMMSRLVLACCLLIGLSAFRPLGAVIGQETGRYYPETGHTLEAAFLEFFESHGGVGIFGYPITDSFEDPRSGVQVQYTENARLEWVVGEASESGTIVLQPLGELLKGQQPPIPADRVDLAGCRYFDATGHATCYAFLDFFEAYGDEGLFGPPLSEFLLEDNRIVQYFRNFRLDWYPEAPTGLQVRVAPLGRLHFERMGYDHDLLQPATATNRPGYQVTELRPSASVLYPVIAPGGTQHVYVAVRDQNLLPVGGAAVMLVVNFPNRDRIHLMPITDSQGLSRLSLDVGDLPRGSKVTLEIWVIIREHEAVARDSFLVW